MSEYKTVPNVKLNVRVRTNSSGMGDNRKFQADLETLETLSGEKLTAALACFGYEGNTIQAARAILTIEEFIKAKLAEGKRLDFGLATFYPLLSGGLSARDVDPETDGIYVKGAVKARGALADALREKIESVNPLARRAIRIFNVFDRKTEKFDVIVPGNVLSVSGKDIALDLSRADEGFWLEKRSGHWNRKPTVVCRAEVLRSDLTCAEIVFQGPIASGKYNLVVGTRCGDGPDYKVRRIGHPVTVAE